MIRIDKINALIGIDTTSSKLILSQPPADFEIEKKEARVRIHAEQVRVVIDQRQCFNESGLMDFLTLTEDAKQRGKQAVLEGIGRLVAEGNQMAAIENKQDAIVLISESNSVQMQEYNIEAMPKSRPKVDFVGGTVDIKVEEGYVSVNVKPNKPQIDVEPGRVEVFLRQKPHISFEYVGENLDKKV